MVTERVKPKWLTEPYHHEFEYKGYPVVMKRSEHNMIWRGYVGVSPNHTWYQKDYDKIDNHVHVHGGLTFAGDIKGDGFPDGYFWFGFDCAHAGDLTPGTYYQMLKHYMDKLMESGTEKKLAYSIAKNHPSVKLFEGNITETVNNNVQFGRLCETYKDMDYVIAECKKLVDQIEAVV